MSRSTDAYSSDVIQWACGPSMREKDGVLTANGGDNSEYSTSMLRKPNASTEGSLVDTMVWFGVHMHQLSLMCERIVFIVWFLYPMQSLSNSLTYILLMISCTMRPTIMSSSCLWLPWTVWWMMIVIMLVSPAEMSGGWGWRSVFFRSVRDSRSNILWRIPIRFWEDEW